MAADVPPTQYSLNEPLELTEAEQLWLDYMCNCIQEDY